MDYLALDGRLEVSCWRERKAALLARCSTFLSKALRETPLGSGTAIGSDVQLFAKQTVVIGSRLH